jgi:ABC-type amino acid transport substrate-binding protein
MKKIIVIFILFLLFFSCEKKENNIILKGKVFDENGNPLSNVTIIVEDLDTHFITEDDGKFIISYPFEKRTYTLKFYKDGFVEEEVKVDIINSENEIEVTLKYNTYEKIAKKGVLIIGTSLTNKPLSYTEGGNKLGFEMDLIRKISEKLALSPIIFNIRREDLIKSLINRDIDIVISSISKKDINNELLDDLIFSKPYFIDGYVMIVRENENRIKDFSSLNSRNVYVTEKNLIDIVKTFSPNVKKVELEKCIEYCLEDLGRVLTDVIITKYSTAAYYTKRYKKIKILDFVYDKKEYSIILRKEDKEVLNKINEILQNLIEIGDYYKIYNSWFYPLDKFKVN